MSSESQPEKIVFPLVLAWASFLIFAAVGSAPRRVERRPAEVLAAASPSGHRRRGIGVPWRGKLQPGH